jgi:hypothetical protein
MDSPQDSGLESLYWDKHSRGSELLTGGVNFLFHSDFEARRLWTHILAHRDSGYPHPLGSQSLVSGAFTEESEKISHGILYDRSTQKKNPA